MFPALDTCTWVIKDGGWYGGTEVLRKGTSNKNVCAASCCKNPLCVTWTWRNSDKMCILKRGDDLWFATSKGHYTSIKMPGALPM